MTAIWAAVISVVGTVLLAPLGLFLAGKLIPLGRLTDAITQAQTRIADLNAKRDAAEKQAETWKQSYDTIKDAYDRQLEILERQQQTNEIIDKVMQAVNKQIDTRLEQNRGVISP